MKRALLPAKQRAQGEREKTSERETRERERENLPAYKCNEARLGLCLPLTHVVVVVTKDVPSGFISEDLIGLVRLVTVLVTSTTDEQRVRFIIVSLAFVGKRRRIEHVTFEEETSNAHKVRERREKRDRDGREREREREFLPVWDALPMATISSTVTGGTATLYWFVPSFPCKRMDL